MISWTCLLDTPLVTQEMLERTMFPSSPWGSGLAIIGFLIKKCSNIRIIAFAVSIEDLRYLTPRYPHPDHVYLFHCIYEGPDSNWAKDYRPTCFISWKAEVMISSVNNYWLTRGWSSPTKIKRLFESLQNIWSVAYEESHYPPRVHDIYFIWWQRKGFCSSN